MAADENINLLLMCWIDITWEMLDIRDLVYEDPDVNACVEGRNEALDVEWRADILV